MTTINQQAESWSTSTDRHRETPCPTLSKEAKRKRVVWEDDVTAPTGGQPSVNPPKASVVPTTNPAKQVVPQKQEPLFSPKHLKEVSRRESIENRILFCSMEFPLRTCNTEFAFCKLFNETMYHEGLTYFDNAAIHCTFRHNALVLEFLNADMATRALTLNNHALVEHHHRGAETPNHMKLTRPFDYSVQEPETSIHPRKWRMCRGKKHCQDLWEENKKRGIIVQNAPERTSATALAEHFRRLLEERSWSVRQGNPVANAKQKGDSFYLTLRTQEETALAFQLQDILFRGAKLRLTIRPYNKLPQRDMGPPISINEEHHPPFHSNVASGTGIVTKPVEENMCVTLQETDCAALSQDSKTESRLELEMSPDSTRKEFQLSEEASRVKLQLALDELQATRRENDRLQSDLDQANTKLSITLSQLETTQQDNAKLQSDVDEAKLSLKDTLTQLDASKDGKAKLQSNLDQANALLGDTLRQLAATKQEKNQLQADLDDTNMEHEETLGRLEAANRGKAKLRDALDQSQLDAAIQIKSQNKVFLLMEKDLTATRDQLERVTQELALLAKRGPTKVVESILRNKRRVSMDYQVVDNSISKIPVSKVSPDKPKAILDTSKNRNKAAQRKNVSGPRTDRYNQSVNNADQVSSYTKPSVSKDYTFEGILQHENKSAFKREEVDYCDI
jgi:hypothetical protein